MDLRLLRGPICCSAQLLPISISPGRTNWSYSSGFLQRWNSAPVGNQHEASVGFWGQILLIIVASKALH